MSRSPSLDTFLIKLPPIAKDQQDSARWAYMDSILYCTNSLRLCSAAHMHMWAMLDCYNIKMHKSIGTEDANSSSIDDDSAQQSGPPTKQSRLW